MKIAFKGMRMPATDANKARAVSQLEPLEKILPVDAHVYVETGRTTTHHKSSDTLFQASVLIDSKGNTYYARVQDADLNTALDRACRDVIESVRQEKGRKQTLARRGRMIIKRLTKSAFYE